MNTDIRNELKKELALRGFVAGTSPNHTMTLDDEFLSSVGVGELMETLVARREKIFHSGNVVGMDEAKKGYDDVAGAIGALKSVIERLVLPA